MEINKDIIKRAEELCSFLDRGVTPYHVILNSKEMLSKEGFIELCYKDNWVIRDSIKGFVQFNSSSLFAFSLNKNTLKKGIKFITSHVDSPSLKIKSGSDILNENRELYLNVEVYGGVILNTWLDRGLSVGGRVFISDGHNMKIKEVLVDFQEEIAFIPNCPIHLNKEVNSGFALNKQTHMLPIVLTNIFSKDISLRCMVATHLNIQEEQILDFDLYLYDAQKAEIIGYNKEFIQSKHIDDLSMSEASLYALINSRGDENKFICLFDGEEIGSSIPEGGNSLTFLNIMNRLYDSMKIDNEDRFISIDNSFMISADMAHAYNFNYSQKFDKNNSCLINNGIVIKNNCNRNYITTGESSSYIKSLCNKINVPYQVYHNRSDMVGGSTLGPIVNRYLPIKGIDIGNPMFAMHSCRETAGVCDHYYMSRLFVEYFSK